MVFEYIGAIGIGRFPQQRQHLWHHDPQMGLRQQALIGLHQTVQQLLMLRNPLSSGLTLLRFCPCCRCRRTHKRHSAKTLVYTMTIAVAAGAACTKMSEMPFPSPGYPPWTLRAYANGAVCISPQERYGKVVGWLLVSAMTRSLRSSR
jgi:hypothetical protein